MTASVTLADQARQRGRRHPPRTPGRRAAAAVYVALTTTKTTDAARRALDTFGDPAIRAAAKVLLDVLHREVT